MTTAIVIINQHEPEGEVTALLLELAEEKGHDPRTVEAQRGEHDAALAFRVPADVAEAFDADRADRWPADKIENDAVTTAGVDQDAYAADQARRANDTRAANADEKTSTPNRTSRPGKAKE
jgi:hypothetical protein